jgi:hypothetical protein
MDAADRSFLQTGRRIWLDFTPQVFYSAIVMQQRAVHIKSFGCQMNNLSDRPSMPPI